MRIWVLITVPALFSILSVGICAGADGTETLRLLEAVLKERDAAAVRDFAEFLAHAKDFSGRKVREPCRHALEILDAISPGNPEVSALKPGSANLPVGAPAEIGRAKSILKKAVSESKKTWSALLDRCAKNRLWSTGCAVARVCIALDQDDAQARAQLGFVKKGSKWLSLEDDRLAVRKLEQHEKWGCVTKSDIGQFNAGKRPFGNSWIPAKDEEDMYRTWATAVEMDEGRISVRSTMNWDKTRSFAKRCTARFEELQHFFGDFFPPANNVCTIYIARSEADFAALMTKFEHTPDMNEHASFFQPTHNQIFFNVRNAEIFNSGKSDENFIDYLSDNLTAWILMQDNGDSYCTGSGYWIFAATKALASTRHLDRRFGENNGTLDAFEKFFRAGSLPKIRDLIGMESEKLNGSYQAYTLGIVLAHFFLHSGKGELRGAFAAHLKDYVFDYPCSDSTAALNLTDPRLDEDLLAHVKELRKKR